MISSLLIHFLSLSINLRFPCRAINAVIEVLAISIVHPQLHHIVVDVMTKQRVARKIESGAAAPDFATKPPAFFFVVNFLLHTLNSTLRIPNTKSSSSAIRLVFYYAFSSVLVEDTEKSALVMPAEFHSVLLLGPIVGGGARPFQEPDDPKEEQKANKKMTIAGQSTWGPEQAAALLEREMSESKSQTGCETVIARCIAGLNLNPEHCPSLEWLSTTRRFLASPPNAKTDYW